MVDHAAGLANYLDCVFGRSVAHRHASDTDLTGIAAPEGVHVVLHTSPVEHRVFAAEVFIDPPLQPADLATITEQRIDLDDRTSRLLLAVATQHHGPNGPSRVTVGLPTAVLDAGEPVAQLAIMFPDQHTAPTGVTLDTPVSADWEPRLDLAALLDEDSTLRRLHDLVDGHDDLTGIAWCDDAADLFATPRHGDTRYGMPPHFLPLIALGVDDMVLGLVWDRPETGRLEAQIPLKGWIAGHIRAEFETADARRREQLDRVLDLVGRSTESAGPGMGSGVERCEPNDLETHEVWVPFVYGGDGTRPGHGVQPRTTPGLQERVGRARRGPHRNRGRLPR